MRRRSRPLRHPREPGTVPWRTARATGAASAANDDEAGSSDVDSDTEEALVCPLERIVRDNLASKTLDLRKTEVMQFVRNRSASLSAVGA